MIRSAIDDQPLAIEHRSVKRQLGAVVCGQCGSTLLTGAKAESQEQLCTVCGNQDIEAGQASTSLPDLVVDHVISEKQARQIALESLEAALTGLLLTDYMLNDQILPLDRESHAAYLSS